jgi:hypothetical protein
MPRGRQTVLMVASVVGGILLLGGGYVAMVAGQR